MPNMFSRYVSIDWSGAGLDHEPVDLGVVEAQGTHQQVVNPPRFPRAKNWTRAECRRWLLEILRPDNPRTIVAIDFGFGLPWAADRRVFGCNGWRQMVAAIAELLAVHKRARAVAEAINQNPEFAGHGPYRFNENRSDFRFYRDRGVAYYRLVENAVPQAISQWYMGSGGTVGYHTLTGLGALHELIALREAGDVSFKIWPHEWDSFADGGFNHLLVESYPALYPIPESFGSCVTAHQRDAWKVLAWMIEADEQGRLRSSLSLKPVRYGRVEGQTFEEQVRFEGWILGVS